MRGCQVAWGRIRCNSGNLDHDRNSESSKIIFNRILAVTFCIVKFLIQSFKQRTVKLFE